jgi:hypothetical protein
MQEVEEVEHLQQVEQQEQGVEEQVVTFQVQLE